MHNLGTLAAFEERFADAIGWYQTALQLDPGSVDLKDNLARAREAAEAENSLVGIMLDLAGPKIRVDKMAPEGRLNCSAFGRRHWPTGFEP